MIGQGNVCVDPVVNQNCTETGDICAFEPTEKASYCVEEIEEEVEDASTPADGISSAIVVLILSGSAATVALNFASAGIEGAVAAQASSGLQFDFDPTTILNFAQLSVMSAQMDLPYVPGEYYSWASSFSWASLNFGIVVPKSDESTTGSTRRLLNDEAIGGVGFARYCDSLGVSRIFFLIPSFIMM